MKYHNLASFDKHLKEAFPHHLSPTYLIVTPCPFERREIAKKIFSLLEKKESSSFRTLDSQTSSVEHVIASLNTLSLFGEKEILFFDGIETIKPLTSLINYISHPNPTSFLILGSSSMKPLADLYQKGKKEIIVLDLSEEKPWEKERRIHEWLLQRSKSQGKNLPSEVAVFLIDKIGPDMAALYQELEKLICFIGDRPSITLTDAKALCLSIPQINSWQLAEKVIWNKEASHIHDKLKDLSFLLLFVGQLRYHLQIGYKIAALLSQSRTPSDIAASLTQVRPQALDKYLPFARERKEAYFQKGLLALYDMELAAKSTSLDPSALFDHFLGRLYS